MIGYDLDRGGSKDSENAPNSFLTKSNGKGFWRFGTDKSCFGLFGVDFIWKNKDRN